MTASDIKTGEHLLKEAFIQQNEADEQIKLMLKLKKKAEIQALSSYGFQYLTRSSSEQATGG